MRNLSGRRAFQKLLSLLEGSVNIAKGKILGVGAPVDLEKIKSVANVVVKQDTKQSADVLLSSTAGKCSASTYLCLHSDDLAACWVFVRAVHLQTVPLAQGVAGFEYVRNPKVSQAWSAVVNIAMRTQLDVIEQVTGVTNLVDWWDEW